MDSSGGQFRSPTVPLPPTMTVEVKANTPSSSAINAQNIVILFYSILYAINLLSEKCF